MRCDWCDGRGFCGNIYTQPNRYNSEWPDDIVEEIAPCPDCHGTGKREGHQTQTDAGKGDR